ncbi:MAG TPA: ABC transporter permease [Candidatus Dormibacteraeota bacterium]|nr:ABC transporter permease [Candidatus Dormibacteraeota bacterium]
MARFLIRRIAFAVITLWLLSVLVFLGAHVLPGDVGRRILGAFASPRAVANLDRQLGVDKPLPVQYLNWLSGAVRFNFGSSLAYRQPVSSLLGPALLNSLKLAAVAFVIVVPLGVVGGVIAALNRGRPLDRIITVSGLSGTVVPEFVSGIVLILLLGIVIRLFPVTATAPPGSGALTQLYYLILPALPLVLVLFGYIARIARAGMIDALDADYTRTAYLKGLSRRTVIWRHVLRNALLPTIAVIATQTGYLIGGLVVIETIFNYHGIGQLLFTAAQQKDFPLIQATVMVIGVVYLVATLLADITYSLLNPRIRLGGAR